MHIDEARKLLGSVLAEDFTNITVSQLRSRFAGHHDDRNVQVVGEYNEIRIGNEYFRVTDLPRPRKKKSAPHAPTDSPEYNRQMRNCRKRESRRLRGKH